MVTEAEYCERPIDALFCVIAVAVLCMCATVAIGRLLGIDTGPKKVPCTYTKQDGFNKVKYHATCELQ